MVSGSHRDIVILLRTKFEGNYSSARTEHFDSIADQIESAASGLDINLTVRLLAEGDLHGVNFQLRYSQNIRALFGNIPALKCSPLVPALLAHVTEYRDGSVKRLGRTRDHPVVFVVLIDASNLKHNDLGSPLNAWIERIIPVLRRSGFGKGLFTFQIVHIGKVDPEIYKLFKEIEIISYLPSYPYSIRNTFVGDGNELSTEKMRRILTPIGPDEDQAELDRYIGDSMYT